MFTKIEDLVTELWLEIFTYLNIQHQFIAFFNLNKRLNQILFAHRYQISWKNNDKDAQYLFKHILPYLTHPEDVGNLRLENTNKIDLINHAKLLYFPRLIKLTLHRLHITQDFLSLFQQNSTHLRYLNMSQLISGEKRLINKLLEMILSLQNLKICRMRLGISMSPMQLTISSKSSITNLSLIGMNEICMTNRLSTFLTHLPYLQSLHIIANQVNLTSATDTKNIISTVPISTLILNINEFLTTFAQFANFILTLTPNVEELKLVSRTPIQDLTYLDHREWIKFINSLPNLKKLTLDINHTSEIDEQMWDKKCQMLTKLMTRNHIILHIGKLK